MKRLLLGLLVPALLAAGGRLDRWRVIGPGGGGAQFIPTVSPHDSARVLVRCDMTGSYISHDAGASWRMFNLRTVTNFFVFDPVDPAVIYAAASASGAAPTPAPPGASSTPIPDRVTGVRIAGDHGEETILTSGPTQGGMTALAVDPADSSVLYAAIGGALHVSTDSGATWAREAAFPDGATRIWIDPASPAADRTLYAAGTRTIAVRERGQWRFNARAGACHLVLRCCTGLPRRRPARHLRRRRRHGRCYRGRRRHLARSRAPRPQRTCPRHRHQPLPPRHRLRLLQQPHRARRPLLVRRRAQHRPWPHMGPRVEVRQPTAPPTLRTPG